MSSRLLSSAIVLGATFAASSAQAFCGFYVAKADTELFNQSSKVAMVRDGDRTVITMANDYQGEPEEFAMVIPVPEVITRDQVHVSDPALLSHLDAYTAPRLVEYFDSNPCRAFEVDEVVVTGTNLGGRRFVPPPPMVERAKSLGVTIEDEFTVGEYDILILSAEESEGLQTWLNEEGYKVPPKARRTLRSYIRQDMKFFVAKVNLEKRAENGSEMLRPIAVAFETPKFMLPIRLGTVNAKGDQDLFVYALTRGGQVETTNYRTQKIPSGQELPVHVKHEFGDVYRDMFTTVADKEGGHGVFMEYAWDMSWCDPCAADPLSDDQLQELGVFWLDEGQQRPGRGRGFKSAARDVFITRLHVRYDAESFPEDLRFKTTGNRDNFQGRYVLRHAFEGDMSCPAAAEYMDAVNKRRETEVKTLAKLTGRSRSEIRDRVEQTVGFFEEGDKPVEDAWWNRIWKDD